MKQDIAEMRKLSGLPLYEAAEFNPLLESWTIAGRAISEAKLSPEQVAAIFGSVEQGARASGTNRTAIGRGADAVGSAAGAAAGAVGNAAAAVNNAYQGIISKIGQLGPVKNFDDAFDSMAGKLKNATGGDEGIAKYVYAYRAFAKNHPVLQNLIYSALIAGVGLATGGVAPIAVLGLFKATDRLLQGDRLSAALIKGGVTAGAAGLFRELQSYLKGAQAPQTPSAAQQQGMMGRGLPDSGQGGAIPTIDQQQGMLGRGLPDTGMGGAIPTIDQQADMLGRGLGTIHQVTGGDTRGIWGILQKMGIDPSQNWQEKLNAVIKANAQQYPSLLKNPDLIKPGMNLVIPQTLMQDKWSDGYQPKGSSNLSEYIDREATIQSWFLSEGVLDDGSRSVWVYETAVPVIFQQIEEAGFFQGLKDIGSSIGRGIGNAAKAVGNYVGTAASNIANKTTADKLNTAWQKSTYSQGGGSVDSKTVVQFLRQMGVEDAVIKSTFKNMKIPFPRGPRKPKAAAPQAAPAQAAPAQAAQAAPAAKPKVRVPAGSKPSTPFKGFGGALQSAPESVSNQDIMRMISEAKNLAQQAAIAINMKKRGKKPKGEK
jgi:hypothetical protein